MMINGNLANGQITITKNNKIGVAERRIDRMKYTDVIWEIKGFHCSRSKFSSNRAEDEVVDNFAQKIIDEVGK